MEKVSCPNCFGRGKIIVSINAKGQAILKNCSICLGSGQAVVQAVEGFFYRKDRTIFFTEQEAINFILSILYQNNEISRVELYDGMIDPETGRRILAFFGVDIEKINKYYKLTFTEGDWYYE